MSIRNLEHALHPRSVAVFGGSERAGSVGAVVMRNLVESGFDGPIWAVNPKYSEVMGRPCFARADDLPEAPDIAVVLTPAHCVPEVIADLGRRGGRLAVVVTAGLTGANGLRQAMLDAARPHLLRIIGPNTLGLMIPPLGLNAGFAHLAARPGNLALLSQSGAIATALIDWAAERDIGFSQIVSLGDMADVDVGDYLDLLAGDGRTTAILMYLESVPAPRKFLSAARAAARLKPVIAIKAGRHAAAAKAAATHTGALAGADAVVDAALRRSGILRVRGLAELFDAAETLARFRPLAEGRVGIVTNGGGAGRPGRRPADGRRRRARRTVVRDDRGARSGAAAELEPGEPGRHHRRCVAGAISRRAGAGRGGRRRRRRAGDELSHGAGAARGRGAGGGGDGHQGHDRRQARAVLLARRRDGRSGPRGAARRRRRQLRHAGDRRGGGRASHRLGQGAGRAPARARPPGGGGARAHAEGRERRRRSGACRCRRPRAGRS
jgi:succinyl-CoA synthetase alpha subunit